MVSLLGFIFIHKMHELTSAEYHKYTLVFTNIFIYNTSIPSSAIFILESTDRVQCTTF